MDTIVRKKAAWLEHAKTLRSLTTGLFVQQEGFTGMRNFPREILRRALAKHS